MVQLSNDFDYISISITLQFKTSSVTFDYLSLLTYVGGLPDLRSFSLLKG